MNWIDTPLLVYGALDGHPARPRIQALLVRGAWASSVLVLGECFHILARDYALPRSRAAATCDRLAAASIHWAPLDTESVTSSFDCVTST